LRDPERISKCLSANSRFTHTNHNYYLTRGNDACVVAASQIGANLWLSGCLDSNVTPKRNASYLGPGWLDGRNRLFPGIHSPDTRDMRSQSEAELHDHILIM